MSTKPLESYLAPAPARVLWYLSCAALLLAAGLYLGWQAWRQQAQVVRLEQRRNDLQTQQAARNVPPPSKQQVDEQKQWAQLKLERDFPWNKVFRVIERSATPDIELLEFHPDKLNRMIVLRGEARNVDSLLMYLQSLGARSDWSEIHLTHQQTVQRDKLVTVSFEIKAKLPG